MGKHKDKSKKHKRDKKHKHRMRDSSSSSSEEWVEKGNFSSSDEDKSSGGKSDKKQIDSSDTHTSDINKSENREDWMSLPDSFLTESNIDRRKNRENNKRLEKQRAQYNPREHVRELNPYWKDGGDGLPKFKKPTDDGDYKYKRINQPTTSSNWRKKESECSVKPQESTTEESSEILSDKELNILASKLVKAEIMGNTKLVKELKEKLDNARKQRESAPSKQMEGVILTQTDSKGYTRPLKRYSGGETLSSKKKKVETHQSGQRMRYFPDDDKHSLQQMFENEKYNTAEEQDKEFMKLAGRVRKNDDADEIFADNIRTKESDDKIDSKNRNKAIIQHQKIVQNMDNCRLCLQSENMLKHLMITLGETVFLSLPSHEPLTEGHCLISPIRHVSSSTHLDENEWSEIMDFRKSLTKMFLSNNEDVIFFETARNFHNYPHMSIECIPLDKEEGDMAPIYFKKAIDECEAEWAQNKKLVSLKGKDVRKAIPKGLPYFFVSFGMDEGYAHVLEDQKHFPNNFAQEIIGGMLDLHHSKWRKPRQEAFDEQSKRVQEFSKRWSPFDCTKT